VRRLAERAPKLTAEVGGGEVGGACERRYVERLAVAGIHEVLRADEMPDRMHGRHRTKYRPRAEPDRCHNARVATLPSGTVTFVFSDVEGSTGLLKRLGERYGELIGEHRRIVRETYGTHDGVEIDAQGDAFFFAFARARDAVAAAVAAQRAHAEQEWPDGEQVRVRMGLHTGEPALADEGYLGLDVVRAARLCTAGQGGHVLLSETTRALVGSSLPEGVSIHPVGERRLKDIEEPERVYALAIQGVDLAESELPAPAEPSVDWDRRAEELARRMTDKINESVFRSLERSLGGP
jgi:class 3 adenylate cyclase